MSVIACRTCGFEVNAEAIGCPECGGDPRVAGSGDPPIAETHRARPRGGLADAVLSLLFPGAGLYALGHSRAGDVVFFGCLSSYAAGGLVLARTEPGSGGLREWLGVLLSLAALLLYLGGAVASALVREAEADEATDDSLAAVRRGQGNSEAGDVLD